MQLTSPCHCEWPPAHTGTCHPLTCHSLVPFLCDLLSGLIRAQGQLVVRKERVLTVHVPMSCWQTQILPGPQTSIAHSDCPELSNRHWGTFSQALSSPWERQQLAVRNEFPRSLRKYSRVHMGPGGLIPTVLCRCNHVTPGNVPPALCSRGRETVNEPKDSKWHRPQRDLEGSREAGSLEK